MILGGPLLRPKSLSIQPGGLCDGCLPLRCEQVHGSVGKIIEAARMIEVEVCEHDVPHVSRVEAQPLNLADGVLVC